jgi:hypothetical protein
MTAQKVQIGEGYICDGVMYRVIGPFQEPHYFDWYEVEAPNGAITAVRGCDLLTGTMIH